MNQPGASSFFERYDHFIRSAAVAAGPASELSNMPRLRHRHAALISRNRGLFQGARVLDLMSSSGFWSLAALDAGAAHVVGLESARKALQAATASFAECHVAPKTYQFVHSELFAGLRKFEPGSFDLVLCRGFLERSDPRFFFQQLSRLRIKNVILDTRIVRGKGPIIRLTQGGTGTAKASAAARYNSMLSLPNHELITFFCDYYQLRWRQIDWQTLGITDWAGIADYQSDRRRTYVLEGAVANAAAGSEGRLRVAPIKRG